MNVQETVESITGHAPKARQAAYRRIANGLRGQILSGQFAPGDRLPSERELTVIWKSSSFTVHTALQALMREGWIASVPSAGNFVANFKNRFVCAGIYYGTNIFSREQAAFQRTLHTALLEQLGKLRKETQVFVDSRPENKQGKVLPALAEAVLHRRIQCLIAPALNAVDTPALTRLPIATAFMANPFSPNQVSFDQRHFFREGLHRLAAQGCRSIGLISNPVPTTDNDIYKDFYPSFQEAARDAELVTRDEWVLKPRHYVSELPEYGYREFLQLWRMSEKPDGVVVLPDMVVSGVITAILQTGLHLVTERMKFIFHRNAHIHFLCPFPVTWAISDEDMLAKELIQLIEKQFRGEKISPTLLPYVFEKTESFV